MAFLDFLNNGAAIPAGSAVTATDTTTSGPSWLTDYVKNLLAKQAAVGDTPYATYPGDRTAPVNPDMVNSYQMARDAAGAYKPGLATAEGLVNKAAGTSALGAANPYLGAASNTLGGAVAQPGGVAYAQPLISAGSGAVTGGLNGPTGMSSAMPWLTAASGNTADVSSYMNPYTDSVVDRIGDLGQRNLMEKIMPGLEGRYIKSGQFQGSGQMTDTMRAVRDTSADILAAQSSALQQGYGAAQTAKAADLARYGTLGATAGQLGGTDRATTIQGGTALGAMGNDLGALGVADRNALINAGQAQGALGSTAANAAGTDATNVLNAGKTAAEIAAQQQSLGLAGANAVNAGGVQQRGIDTESRANSYADFLRQQGYPQAQIDAAVATLKGTAGFTPAEVTKAGIEPQGYAPVNQPSTTSDIASLLAGAGGLFAAAKGA